MKIWPLSREASKVLSQYTYVRREVTPVKKLILALLASLAFVPAAHALEAKAKLSWTQPTTRVDGAALGASEIKHYTVKWGLTSGTWPNEITVPAPTLTHDWASVVDVPVGLSKTVYFTVTVTTWGGEESDPAVEGKKSFTNTSGAKPTAPVLTVGAGTCTTNPGFKCVVLP